MKTIDKYIVSLSAILFFSFAVSAQNINVPKSYANIKVKKNKVGISYKKQFYPLIRKGKPYKTFENFTKDPVGTTNGVAFDFKNEDFEGKIHFGLIKTDGVKYPLPVYFKRTVKIKSGKAEINLKNLAGVYDYIDWEQTKKLRLGYRIISKKGEIIYDGRVNLKGSGPFQVDLTITEGPFVNKMQSDRLVISFKTNKLVMAQIRIGERVYSDIFPTKDHQIEISDLKPQTDYDYTVIYDGWKEHYHFKTAPKKGCRSAFTFAYASDSRAGKGGGERNLYGVNAYVMKKMVMFADYKNAAFFQFTGDMISGYKRDNGVQNLQYANWKRVMENFWHNKPVYVGMGNHEAIKTTFKKTDYTGKSHFEGEIAIDKFPFDKYSAEKTFADNFVLPESNLKSEDGNRYDPSKKSIDFPSYKENVYSYTYGNLAVIVMNSNYWYAPTTMYIPISSGNVHGYIMDNQLAWLQQSIKKFEEDKDIDHVIVTFHTPAFPNAGHSGDDMWYDGNNEIRPYIAGKPVQQGIIERRDQLLDILVNQSKKFVALLAGDEHNYSRLIVDNNTPIYPKSWTGKRLRFNRPFVQITNGSAGAPYYSLEKLPWTKSVQKFSTLHALMLFKVDGQHIDLEVINPDTFEKIEQVKLR